MRQQGRSREQLLEAAGRLFAQAGVQGVSLVGIHEAAGVSKATLYKYFPSKEDLVVAYLFEALHRETALLEALAVEVKTSHQARAAILQFTQFPQEERLHVFFVALVAYPDPAHPIRVALTNWASVSARVIATLLSTVGFDDAQERASEIMILWWGAVARHHIEDPARTLRQFERQVANLLE